MRNRMWIALCVAILLSILLVGAALAQGDVAKGKDAWTAHNCKSCHGPNGEGKYCAPRAGDGRPLDAWLKQVRTPFATMPRFRADQLSDADITDMWAYMQTLPKPATFAPIVFAAQPSDPPGWVLFNTKKCVSCHGKGDAYIKARFVDKGRAVTAEAVIKQLRTPASFMGAFTVAQVTDAEAVQIAAYLATFAPAAAPVAAATPATLPKTGAGIPQPLLLALAIIGGCALVAAGARLLFHSQRS